MPWPAKESRQVVRALAVAERMNSHYGEAACALHYTTPFTLTIAVLLSAQTTDAGVNRVTPELFVKYGTPQAMAQKANPEDIARIIRSFSWVLPHQSKKLHRLRADDHV